MFLSRPPTTCTHNVQFLLAVSERLISLKCFLETTPQVLKRIKYRFFLPPELLLPWTRPDSRLQTGVASPLVADGSTRGFARGGEIPTADAPARERRRAFDRTQLRSLWCCAASLEIRSFAKMSNVAQLKHL